MTSTEERREAARMLREQADEGYNINLESVAYALGFDSDDGECGDEDVFNRLADLILSARTTGEIVRCRDCKLYDREDGLCYRDPDHSGCYRPAHDDGFCSWGVSAEEDKR